MTVFFYGSWASYQLFERLSGFLRSPAQQRTDGGFPAARATAAKNKGAKLA